MQDLLKTTAICVRTVDYKDDDRILTLFSLDYGRLSAYARGVKKPKAKLKNAAVPLCFGDYLLARGKSMYTLAGCEITDTFFDVHKNPENYYASYAVLELLDAFVIEEADAELFILALNTLRDLCYTDKPAQSTMRVFLYEFLKNAGYIQERAADEDEKKELFEMSRMLRDINGRDFRALVAFLNLLA